MGYEKKGSPEDRRANSEVIVEVTGARAHFRLGLAVFVEATFAEAVVGARVVGEKVEIVTDQRSACEGVVAHTVSADPRIEQRKGDQEEKEEPALGFARRMRG